ncbi:hypothetical protein MCEMSEM23_01138 [Rhabdaerophilaceae bacterium]
MLRFRRMRSLQKFAAVHGSIHNHFNQQRHLTSRSIFNEHGTTILTPRPQRGAARAKLDWGSLWEKFGVSDSVTREPNRTLTSPLI